MACGDAPDVAAAIEGSSDECLVFLDELYIGDTIVVSTVDSELYFYHIFIESFLLSFSDFCDHRIVVFSHERCLSIDNCVHDGRVCFTFFWR